jgi:hypothetical protein
MQKPFDNFIRLRGAMFFILSRHSHACHAMAPPWQKKIENHSSGSHHCHPCRGQADEHDPAVLILTSKNMAKSMAGFSKYPAKIFAMLYPSDVNLALS